VYDHILYYNVIQKRKAQLDQIREEFSKTPVLKYLQERPFLIDAAFPRQEDMSVPIELLLRRIVLIDGDERKQEVFDQSITCLTEVLNKGEH
jgi:hypothetical protein